MNNQTLEKLRQMRLFGMHDAFKTSLENTIKEKMTQDQFVSHLVHSEWDNRKNRAVERAVRAAQFRYNATLDDVDYTFERGLDRNQVERLAAMEFVRDHKDLIITGPTGTGKSYLATALGYKACQDGFRVMYASTAKLMSQLKISKAKGTILADLKRIERVDLMILDDFCMQPLDAQSRGILTAGPYISVQKLMLPQASATEEPRALLLATIEAGGDTIVFASTHLSLSAQSRRMQAEFIAREIGSLRFPALLGGGPGLDLVQAVLPYIAICPCVV